MSRGRRLIAVLGLALLAADGGWARVGTAQGVAPNVEDVPGAPLVLGDTPLAAPDEPTPLGEGPPGGFLGGLPEDLSPTPLDDEEFPGDPPGAAVEIDEFGDPTAAVEPAPPGATSPTSPLKPSGAPLDPEVRPVQSAPAAPAPAAAPGGPFLVSPDRLRDGAQNVGVSVQVYAPAAMNLNKPGKIAIVVKNTGAADALSVVVRDQLPPGTQFVEATPAPEGDTSAGLLVWNLGDLSPGVEKRLDVTVTPTTNGNQDHAATAHFLTGSRARTIVQEPKLRVEQTGSRGPILRGEQARFDIVVTNTGTGPARNVLVRAELSDGLSHPSEGRVLELDLADLPENPKTVLRPGETVRLPGLIVDTLGGGEHTCTVKVSSLDVVEAPEGTSVQSVTIVEPKLDVAVEGPPLRYTETEADYTLTISNPGTAVAKSVRLTATLVGDARLYQPTLGGVWDAGRRSITWDLPQLAVGETRTFPVRVKLGSVGSFQVNGEVVAAGRGLKDHASVSTSVEGNALLELDVAEDLRLFDVGQMTVFRMKIRNIGTKEARQVKLKTQLSDTLQAIETAGTEEEAVVDRTSNIVIFPTLESLPAGSEITLQIKAEAVKGGLATCRAFLSHQDIQYEVEDVANATVIDAPRR